MCVCVLSEGLISKFNCMLKNEMKFNIIQQECPTLHPGEKHIIYGVSVKIKVTPQTRRLRPSFQTFTALLVYFLLIAQMAYCLFKNWGVVALQSFISFYCIAQ